MLENLLAGCKKLILDIREEENVRTKPYDLLEFEDDYIRGKFEF